MRRWLILVIVFLVVLGGIWLWFHHSGSFSKGPLPSAPIVEHPQKSATTKTDREDRSVVVSNAVAVTNLSVVVAPTPPPPAQVVKPASIPPIDAAVARAANPESVEYYSNTQVPFEQRLKTIQELGKKTDPASRALLVAIGDAPIYANRYAVEALGSFHDNATHAYLESKLSSSDALMVCAAVRALGQWAAASIPAYEQVLEQNQTRPDGHELIVCKEVVTMLGLTASPQAAPALIHELSRADSPTWDLSYGSAIIAAIRNIGSKEARKAVGVYADLLVSKLPSEPMARKAFEDKIAEARAVAQ